MFGVLTGALDVVFGFLGVVKHTAATPMTQPGAATQVPRKKVNKKKAQARDTNAAHEKARKKRKRAQAILTAHKSSIKKRTHTKASVIPEQKSKTKRAWATGSTASEQIRDNKIYYEWCDNGSTVTYECYRRMVLDKHHATQLRLMLVKP